MQRWYPDRIGGMFTPEAERTTLAMLEQPRRNAAAVEITYGDLVQLGRSARHAQITLDGTVINGFAKDLETARPEPTVFIATLAALTGARSVPYLYLEDARQVFSPVGVPAPASLEGQGFAGLCPVSVGALGQFKWWINDADGEHNAARCRDTNAFYLYDHEMADPEHRTASACDQFIELSLQAQSAPATVQAFKYGATAMVTRIQAVTEERMLQVRAHLDKGGFLIEDDFIGGLIDRREQLQKPVYPHSIFDWRPPKFG